jgi:hypothetical protein
MFSIVAQRFLSVSLDAVFKRQTQTRMSVPLKANIILVSRRSFYRRLNSANFQSLKVRAFSKIAERKRVKKR